jgi:3-deoxy-D-manno-octulosonate 8-phosphate phosphatase (KDO 8-P phosphatase)
MDKKELEKFDFSDIKVLIFDVDGVLTDGKIYISESGEEIKCFFAHDGAGIRIAKKLGMKVGFISARRSAASRLRAEELDIDFYIEGCRNKLGAVRSKLEDYSLSFKNVFYMGDDIVDIELLKVAGFSATVPEAPEYIKKFAQFVTEKNGGHGAVREICDIILEKKGLLLNFLKDFEN